MDLKSILFAPEFKLTTVQTLVVSWHLRTQCEARCHPKDARSLVLLFLLILSGDVDCNPRPTKPNYMFPCVGCTKPVCSNQHRIECSWCFKWTPLKCSASTTSDYLSMDGQEWFCTLWIVSDLPFYDSSPSSPHVSLQQCCHGDKALTSKSTLYVGELFEGSDFGVRHLNIRSVLPKLVVCGEVK